MKYKIKSTSVRKCRVCGCTQNHACLGGCYWVEPDLCSQCVGEEYDGPIIVEAKEGRGMSFVEKLAGITGKRLVNINLQPEYASNHLFNNLSGQEKDNQDDEAYWNGYCFPEINGHYYPPVRLNSPEGIFSYLNLHKQFYPEVRIVDPSEDAIVAQAINGKIVFPDQLAEQGKKEV